MKRYSDKSIENLTIERPPEEVFDDLYRSFKDTKPGEGFSDSSIQYLNELMDDHPVEYIDFYIDLIAGARQDSNITKEHFSSFMNGTLGSTNKKSIAFETVYQEEFRVSFDDQTYDESRKSEIMKTKGIDPSNKVSIGLYLFAQDFATEKQGNTRVSSIEGLWNPITIQAILLKKSQPTGKITLPSKPNEVTKTVPIDLPPKTYEADPLPIKEIVLKELIEEHGNDSLPTSNENLIPIETAETIALAQKKAAEQVEQYRLAKKQKKMLQKQLPQKKDQKIVKKPFFTKRRNRKTSMDDGYETVPLDPTIISYYSVHPSYNTGGIRLLTTAQKESNTLENLFIEVEEKPRTPIGTIQCYVENGSLLPTLLNGEGVHAVPTGEYTIVEAYDGQYPEFEFLFNPSTQEYRVKTNYSGFINIEVGIGHEYSSSEYSLPHELKSFDELSISDEGKAMLSKAYEARDNYTALLGIIKSYVNQKFQYTTLKDFYHSDPEERDRNSQYMYGDCDVMAEQVVFYLTQLGIQSEMQSCYMDTNRDGTIMSGEAHAIVKIHLPDGTVRREDITTWIDIAEFQDPKATEVPYASSKLQNIYSNEGKIDSDGMEKLYDSLLIRIEKVNTKGPNQLLHEMNVITQKENLTAMDVLQYQACWFINNIHDNSYTFDLRVLDYSVSHKITFPLIELARKYSEISEIVGGYGYMQEGYGEIYWGINDIINLLHTVKKCLSLYKLENFIRLDENYGDNSVLKKYFVLLEDGQLLKHENGSLYLDDKVISEKFIAVSGLTKVDGGYLYFEQTDVGVSAVCIDLRGNTHSRPLSEGSGDSIGESISKIFLDGTQGYDFSSYANTTGISLTLHNGRDFVVGIKVIITESGEVEIRKDDLLTLGDGSTVEERIDGYRNKITLENYFSMFNEKFVLDSHGTPRWQPEGRNAIELFENPNISLLQLYNLLYGDKYNAIITKDFEFYGNAENNPNKTKRFVSRATHDDQLDKSYHDYMKQAAKLDKQRVDLENQYRKEISDSQRSQIIDAMWQSYMSPEGKFSNEMHNIIYDERPLYSKIEKESVDGDIKIKFEKNITYGVTEWKQKLLEKFLFENKLWTQQSGRMYSEFIIADSYAKEPNERDKFLPGSCLGSDKEEPGFVSRYPHLMPEAFYDKYPEMLPKKLNSESIDTYDQMMEIFAPNSRLLPQDFHRIGMAVMIGKTEEQLIQEQEAHVQKMLEKTPGYTELEDAQDELRMNYLAKRERILEYNRELYSDYKNLELGKKHEIYDELAGFQIPFIKKYVAEIYDRLHYDHDKGKHIFYNNYDKEIGDLNSYEVLDTNGYDILSYMLQGNDIAEIKKISYGNNYKNILRMIRRILDGETIMIQISDLTEEGKDDIKNYVLYMIESLEERGLGLVSNKIHNIFGEGGAFKVYHDGQLVAFRAILDDIQSLLPKDKDYYDTIVEKQGYYNLKLVPKRQDLLDQALEKCLLEGSQKVTSFQDYRKGLGIMERRLFLRLQETANE